MGGYGSGWQGSSAPTVESLRKRKLDLAELDRRGLILKFLSEPDFLHCARITLGTPEETSCLLEAFQEVFSTIPAIR